jgi:hypothetical protein
MRIPTMPSAPKVIACSTTRCMATCRAPSIIREISTSSMFDVHGALDQPMLK